MDWKQPFLTVNMELYSKIWHVFQEQTGFQAITTPHIPPFISIFF